MKKLFTLSALLLLMAGCASLAPDLIVDWTRVNAADVENLKNGIFTVPAADLLNACAESIKAEGWAIDKQDSEKGIITTVQKHGVGMYGSMDYGMRCEAIKQDNNSIKVKWLSVAYLSRDQVNTDVIEGEAALKWNYSAYRKLNIKIEPAAVPTANRTSEAATTVPATGVTDADLPAPPKSEE